MNRKTLWRAAAAFFGLPLMALAQTHPAHPAGDAPALQYQSAFSDYKPWRELKRGDWRAVNDTVGSAKHSGSHGAGAAPSEPARPAEAARSTAPAHGPSAAPSAAPYPPAGHSGMGAHQ
ncbi:hypothetical protein WG922_09130 [Ramlibacter sp. AN1015]|uniref:hypothetical protein n=1 Tax=Ramlibacter sp. AN1015 TaxID=3133428 RepID=UPI0030C4552B